ncbi:LacI family DNA-binding transcriptional regulator [Enterococcus saccharolyticus]|uniref:LacI family transcriptional regulator n=1 Tax=Candidatus Enterococcus willemsii TaxID=1857215 RepID=A0ABQ6Z077_9ENTE|nr:MULTISPECIES: LacI family DNA-binding transcriptional regulator [Enterococcus]KAF1304352.1 LacI family transcriptional regulator [Enterococcus sp. CU12B]MCD5002278.1 LacI family DNA-binding transcriptional regulator [Enterococcus saccharolyticus]
MKLTIRQIAEMAGVSVTTVSQILNNKGSRFSDATRKKVWDIVNEHQYKPDFFASNLITRHSKTIGMIVPDVTDFFFSKIVEGAEAYMNPLGYMLILCNSHQTLEKETQLLRQLAHRSVDGIILATPNQLPEEYSLKSDRYKKMPLILVDRGINQREAGRLIVKEYEGAYQAVSYLIKKGHRDIGMLKESTGYYQLEERYNGYRHALKDAGIPFRRQWVVPGPLTIEGGYNAAKELVRKGVTAIFCGNDAMAMGCYQAIYEQGKKIPEDISVVGFDGLKLSQYTTPPLTTVEQPTFDIGFTAAKFLVDAIEFPEHRIPNKIFDTKLIIRESVKDKTIENDER